MDIQKLIDESLAKKQKEREEREPSGFISPSSLGFCYRKQYWKRKGEKPSNPPDARGIRKFQCGNLFHTFVQQFIPDSQVEIECQKDDVRGRADIVDTDTVYDIKSMHSKGFIYMLKTNYDVRVEKLQAWLQVACYATILNKPKVNLVIVSKDDLLIKQYYDETRNWVDAVARELCIVRKNWLGGLPDAEPRAYGGKECEWSTGCCEYLDKCKEIGGKVWTSTKS